MESVLVLLRQIIIMFLLAGVGYLMFRAGKITLEGNKCIGNILLFLSLPCVIINGFMVERTSELKMAVFIATACPVGANIAVYAQLHNKNYSYAVETVVISTLWSIVSLPAMVWIMEYIIR